MCATNDRADMTAVYVLNCDSDGTDTQLVSTLDELSTNVWNNLLKYITVFVFHIVKLLTSSSFSINLLQ